MDIFSPEPKNEKPKETGWSFADVPKEVEFTSKTSEEKEKLSKRILFAEDGEDFRRLFASMLRSDGYSVDEVEDGLELLEQLEKEKYDLILTDNNMPRMNGIEALEKFRSDPRFSQIPVIVNSADDRIKETVESLGATYFPKGYFKDLIKMIKDRLSTPDRKEE